MKMSISGKESLIESYEVIEDGFHPFLIREEWQVAQLNYIEDQNIAQILFACALFLMMSSIFIYLIEIIISVKAVRFLVQKIKQRNL